MTKIYRQGASGALLDEYERAIIDLQDTISDISETELIKIVDNQTSDSSCRSIQTILSHVVCSGYAYAIYIRRFKGETINFRDEIFHTSIQDYNNHLNDSFNFMVDSLNGINDNQLEESDNNKKLITSWGQIYDIEQILEHAIVHVLRHRRQIEKYKIIVRQ
ncbi:DinB family protein [Flavobacterium hydatis]|uniref:Damage-inducible protein DinB n=1 Tax=Flavobacterium hydatis TaxID=991 RepID=A0A086AKV7_FLAHY|nr:DinB family protein [Flavobacterium hydatis]KFF17321.1 damage-inducible protein DinB [Flavobacterium hydatis]OXA95155.1 damage-inducible protein DinB [Flavobacterium hydatis]